MQNAAAPEQLPERAQLDALDEQVRNRIQQLAVKPDQPVLRSEALWLVRALWPDAFSLTDPKPLQIGIHKEMYNSGLLPMHVIETALRYFTRLERYMLATTVGAKRYDLQGKVCGKVRLQEAVSTEIKLYERMLAREQAVEITSERKFIGKLRLVSRTPV